ncbi:hypothetical protein RF640_17425 [Kocuria sp. CPCC 205231]|uniref:hypothetical protein n=1 Tax=Kocuria sp. CPCC 205231 TaxID=3073551 RepID=UPI0034D5E98B
MPANSTPATEGRPPGRFTVSPMQWLRKTVPKWYSHIVLFYQTKWPFRWLVYGIAVSILGVMSGMVGMRISRAGWGWDVAATEFLTSPGAAGLAAVIAASIAAAMLNRQIKSTREADDTRLNHDKEIEENRTWWESFEWVTSRALAKRSDDPELPPELAMSFLVDLQKWAPNDTQKTACGILVGHLTQSVAEIGPSQLWTSRTETQKSKKKQNQEEYKSLISLEDRVRRVEKALLEAENSAQDELQTGASERRIRPWLNDAGSVERINEAVANYLEATNGTPAFSAVAEGQLYRNEVMQTLFAEQGEKRYQVENSTRSDSLADPDAILRRPSDGMRFNIYIFPQRSTVAQRSKIMAIQRNGENNNRVLSIFIFRDLPDQAVRNNIERQRGHYSVWNGENDTEAMLKLIQEAP